MIISDEVKEFFQKLEDSKVSKDLVPLIKSDADEFSKNIADAILRHRVTLENSWSGYQLTDVNIFYDEDMLKFVDRLEMFGIRQSIPPVRGTDSAMTIMLRFQTLDIWGGIMDTVTAFHVTIKTELGGATNTKIVMYG